MYQTTLGRNRTLLVENGDFRHFRDHLVQEDLLTWMEMETIEAERIRYLRISRFLDIIRTKPDEAAKKFLTILQQTDEVLFSQLEWSAANKENTITFNPSNSNDLGIVQRGLQDWYCSTLSRIHPIPWCEWLELDLDHVFTNLKLIHDQKHHLLQRDEVTDANEIDIFCQIFDSTDNKRSVCFIEGPAGIGKSTLCRRIAYLWAKDGNKIHGHHFDLVAILEARCLTKDFRKCFVEELFPDDFEISEEKIYQNFQTHKSLMIIDGVDELTPEGRGVVLKLLKGKFLRNVHLIITGRPEASREFIMYADTHLRVKGFSVNNIESYICKYFSFDQTNLKSTLLNRLKNDFQLQEVAVNPFTTLLLCLLVQDNSGRIPSTSIKIYHEVLWTTCRNYMTRIGEQSCIKGDLNNATLFNAACVLAYNGFIQRLFVFPEADISTLCPAGLGVHLLKSGILKKDFTVSRLHSRGFCYFPHKSFQEFLCAFYLEKQDLESLKEKLEPLTMTYGLDMNMFRHLLEMLAGQLNKKKMVLESMFRKVALMESSRFVELSECLRCALSLFFSTNSSTSLLDFISGQISNSERLLSIIYYGSLYGYWAGEMLTCVQMAVAKTTFPPVAVVRDSSLTLQTFEQDGTGKYFYFLMEDKQLKLVTEIQIPRNYELVCSSKGLNSLHTLQLNGVTWPFVQCCSVKGATRLLQGNININMLSVMVIPDSSNRLNMQTFMNALFSKKSKILVVFVIFSDQLTDTRLLNTVSLISSYFPLYRIRFIKVQPASISENNRTMIRQQYLLPGSVHQCYYERFCPY